ncbi:unnamed protein product [Linum trigynum]|uniref:Uncharacterized protein n=1 Tax=Linum trigynum TaxID=586398 RepID=A0AAV2GBS6_9ROSI
MRGASATSFRRRHRPRRISFPVVESTAFINPAVIEVTTSPTNAEVAAAAAPPATPSSPSSIAGEKFAGKTDPPTLKKQDLLVAEISSGGYRFDAIDY